MRLRSRLCGALALLLGLVTPSLTLAQIAPTGGHYAGRASDTGFQPGAVNASGGYATSVPLDLPPARGGLPIPLRVVSGGRGPGAAGVGWDVSLSYLRRDVTYQHRRPEFGSDSAPAPREKVTLSLLGRNVDLVHQGTDWVARQDAPDLLVRQSGAIWLVYDGRGLTYTFSTWSALTGAALWVLTSIAGPGGDAVLLNYSIGAPALPTATGVTVNGVSIDLIKISYNPSLTTAKCPKNEIILSYDANTAAPLSMSMVGTVVLTRMHKLVGVDVRARSGCSSPAFTPSATHRLRMYEFAYQADADTGLPRLVTVRVSGRAGTPEANDTLPVASYVYGSATNGGRFMLRKTQSIPLPSMVDVSNISSTFLHTTVQVPPSSSYPYATWQNLIDVDGDGRPDVVFRSGNALWVTRSRPAGDSAIQFGGTTPLVDLTLTKGPLETRTSNRTRFDVKAAEAHVDHVWRKAIDVNGDGRLDIIDAAEQAGRWVFYLNTPDAGTSGVKWVKRSLSIQKLYDLFAARGMPVRDNYLPLTSRYSGRDYVHGTCWRWNGTALAWSPITFPQNQPCGTGGFPDDFNTFASTWQEHTYTQWDITDVNGDGYPDVVFDRNPIDVVRSEPSFAGTADGQTVNFDAKFSVKPRLRNNLGDLGNRLEAVLNLRGMALADNIYPFSSIITLTTSADCGLRHWSNSGSTQTVHCDLTDVNGDGLADRVESSSAYLGTGSGFSKVKLTLPGPLATQESNHDTRCPSGTTVGYGWAWQSSGLRDLTGDGIPDYVSATGLGIGTGTGFAPVVPVDFDTATGVPLSLSRGDEACSGDWSQTTRGIYDIDGDGKAEVVAIDTPNSSLSVYQLVGSAAGTPEAGHLVRLDNGSGARTSIAYRSAKEDGITAHRVPFPEIVATLVQTTGSLGLGGSLSTTSYAYGGAELVYDSWLDAFTLKGYARSIELQQTGGQRNVSVATITDTHPLTPFATSPREERVGRYLRAGRIRDVTLIRSAGTDPWALLSVDVTTDTRRFEARHFDWAVKLYDEPHLAAADVLDCIDLMDPYDFAISFGWNIGSDGVDFCTEHAFLYTSVSTRWTGDAAPPSSSNVETRSRVLDIDDYGRAINVLRQNDRYRTDDDVCVETKYPAPTATVPRVLNAPASRRVWDCVDPRGTAPSNAVWAAETWEYDGLAYGIISNGFVTGHNVERHSTFDGALLGTLRTFDATYDAVGNLKSTTTKREDGAMRSASFDYDVFSVAPTHAHIDATGVPPYDVSASRDALTLDVLASTDPNLSRRGQDFDGFGRIVRQTFTPPGGSVGVVSTVSYLGFNGTDPLGRRIVTTEFSDPVAPANVATTVGRASTTFLDELGRVRRTERVLGSSYANQTLIQQFRSYDGLGRVMFEADPFPSTQDPATAYGTSYFYQPTGVPWCFIRGRGRQSFTTATDESVELYPTCFTRSYANHEETMSVRDAASLLSTSPQAGVSKTTVRSAIGRLVARATVKNGTRLDYVTFFYDHLGQTTSMRRYQDPVLVNNAVVASARFDSLGRVLQAQDDLESATKTFTHSDWGELVEVRWTDTTTMPGTDRRLVAAFDALGRLTHREERNDGVTDPDTVSEYVYDTGVTVGPQVVPTFVLGRLAEVKTPKGAVYYSYDAFGRRNARTFTDATDQYVEKSYFHGDGTLSALELYLPDNGYRAERVDYVYDSAARLRTMKFDDGQVSKLLFKGYDVDAWGRLLWAKLGDGMIDFAAVWADTGRRLLKDVTMTSGSGSRKILYQAYDPIGRELSRRELTNGATTGPTTQHAYDALGRLSAAMKTASAITIFNWQYAYDPLGNLTAANDLVGTADATMSFNTIDHDRICRIGYGNTGLGGTACNVSYDAVGNIRDQPTRNGNRRLTWYGSGSVRTIGDASSEATYRYDGFGEVQELDVSSWGGSGARHDRFFGQRIVRRDEGVGGVHGSFLSRRIPGPNGIVASRRGPANEWIFEFEEAQGKRFFLDGNGAFAQVTDYQPFGEAKSTGAQPGAQNYTHEQWNGGDALTSLGVSRLGARIYDPVIGRFLSRDPLRVPRTAAGTNAYAFAMNDPVNRSDPTGLDCEGLQCTGGEDGGGVSWPEDDINDPSLYFPNSSPIEPEADPQAAVRPPPTLPFAHSPSAGNGEGAISHAEEGEHGGGWHDAHLGLEITVTTSVVVEHGMHALHPDFPSIGGPLKFVKWIGYVGHGLEGATSIYHFIKDPSLATGHEVAATGAKIAILAMGPEAWPLLLGFLPWKDIAAMPPDPYVEQVLVPKLEAIDQQLVQIMGMLTTCNEQTVCRMEAESRLSPEAARWYLQSRGGFSEFGDDFPDVYDDNGYLYSP